MIASPSDVAVERNVIREVLSEWNVVNSRSRAIVLLPLGWDSHAAPDMSRKAQKLINDKILLHADLLVGVFWTRVGTATDDYISGTVAEIEEHIKAGRPAMLYFSSAPVRLDSVNPEQYANLQRFRRSCEERGLCESYSDPNEFRAKLARQLSITMNDAVPPSATTTSSSQNGIPDLSREAQLFLKEAAKSNTGRINRFNMDQALVIQVNGQSFSADLGEGRVRAQYEAALAELESAHLIEDGSSGKRLEFQVTRGGFRVADLLSP